MSNKRGPWLTRRGQADVVAAIDQVIDQQPQPGEAVHQIPDELIEDSPYQARQSLDAQSLADLAQGMREVGFQGVLIIRPHSDPAQRRRGYYQLVYGHRRRAAWRRICAEQNISCVVPVVVRELTDERMLTIGAQENLQRHDLDPIEEAQIVAWHEQLFFDKNQAEIGAMLGKSSDWISVRSRIHAFPHALKERLRQRPRAIGQILELSTLYTQQPDTAMALAEKVVHENLTVVALRKLIREAKSTVQRSSNREEQHNRRANATSVQEITSERHSASTVTHCDQTPKQPGIHPGVAHTTKTQISGAMNLAESSELRARHSQHNAVALHETAEGERDLLLLEEAAAIMDSLASCSDALPTGLATDRALDQVERSLAVLRCALTQRSFAAGSDAATATTPLPGGDERG